MSSNDAGFSQEAKTIRDQNREPACPLVPRGPSLVLLRTCARERLPSCFPPPTTRGTCLRGGALAPPKSAPHRKCLHQEQPWVARCATKPSPTAHRSQAWNYSRGKRL